MTANLPPGFDPGVWEGWRKEGQSIVRKSANGDLLTVRESISMDQGCGYRCTIWHSGEGCAGASPTMTELEAAAFANTYAESHGGWATP